MFQSMERMIPESKPTRSNDYADSTSYPLPLTPFPLRMTPAILQQYLAIGAILFVIGLIGFMTRRNLIVLFLCTEIMFQGVALNFVAFSRYYANLEGQIFVIFLLVIAAAEAALAFGLIVLLFRRRRTLDADAWRELKG